MFELHAILLGAGGSSRLGRAKQLLRFRGETLVARAARQLLTVTPAVTVVTGAEAARVEAELEGLDVESCQNRRWRAGVGRSIALGMERVAIGTRAVLVMLCDQYLLDESDLEVLLRTWRAAPDRITAARWGDAFGPPVIFPSTFFPQLQRLSGDLGARRLLVENRARVTFVELPNAAFDVDDAQDLARLEALDTDN